MKDARIIREWREHPEKMVRDLFGVEPDPWQEEALKVFPSQQRLAMKACKGPGKTCLLAWLIINFMLTRPFPKVIATSITAENLSDNLWPEIAKWQGRSELLREMFLWTKTRFVAKDHPETWFCSARTWPKHGDKQKQADSLAGVHADYVMFLLDESGGIPDAVMASAEAALATGYECKLVQAGNPTHLEGPLWRAVTSERDLWYVVEITGDPDDPKRSTRIDKQWARDQIDKYGRDNPWVLVNVFGKFPPASMNTLLGPDEVEAAMRRKLSPDDYKFRQKRLGLDMARFGDDSTVLFARQGLASFRPHEMRNLRTEEIAAQVAVSHKKFGAELVFIDSTGGHHVGVEDALRMAGITVIPIAFNSKAGDPRYFNRRAEMWFEMADHVKKGGALPPDPNLKKELTTPLYWFEKGRLRLEEKEQIKSRLGFSPDRADALALTFAIPDMEAAPDHPYLRNQREKILSEYDPYEEGRD